MSSYLEENQSITITQQHCIVQQLISIRAIYLEYY